MNPPSGQVTFLFTDIEGSTKLAQSFHDKLPEVLKKHNSILNEVIETNNGFVFKTIGDAFCCAFDNPCDGINAAYEIQMKLIPEDRNNDVIILLTKKAETILNCFRLKPINSKN